MTVQLQGPPPAHRDPTTTTTQKVPFHQTTVHHLSPYDVAQFGSLDLDRKLPLHDIGDAHHISFARNPRKPSPGLAARLKALGFGGHISRKQKSTEVLNEGIGRIPEDQIRQLDSLTRANSQQSIITRRGRAWSGTSGRLPPQIVGDSSSGFSVREASIDSLEHDADFFNGDTRVQEVRARRTSIGVVDDPVMIPNNVPDVDPQKYRLPDHVNGNGTKAMPDTRKTHVERVIPPIEDVPPPPISKDSPVEATPTSTPNDFSGEVQSYFNPFGLQRAGSIYTLSRVSFANQLAQLTSLQLPDAESLSSRVSAIPTSQAATRALMNAAEQIRSWISKASDVLGGLDADDDVEWAAAGGREGLEEVDNAIERFEELVNVYVSAIEELQGRGDIASVASDELKTVVTQVESILVEWEKIRRTLNEVKSQVEIAMEWEELWNVVLGDIGNEMDTLSRLVFEMEEKRHRSLVEETTGVDIGELETIVEETPPSKTRFQASNRFSITAAFPMSPNSPNTPSMTQDDSSLLALFARMQPLRASLDFLPMRLSTFHSRAEKTFPTACDELEARRGGMENSWKRLETDADSLRRELGEDRWVLVFRGAGRQAQKMYESVDRSIVKLKEALEAGSHLNNPSVMGKKIESYETKKLHYGPAIERVLSIIEKGVNDRLTVNGEVVRLHTDMQKKWEEMKLEMKDVDIIVEELQADKRNQQLRDSISSLMSNDRSTIASLNDTPGSSPASSVIMSGMDPSTPAKNGKMRPSFSSLPQAGSRRISSIPAGTSSMSRRGPTSRLSSYGFPSGAASPSPGGRGGSATPTGNRLSRPSLAGADSKPRWNSSVKTNSDPLGLTFNALQLHSPSPHARAGPPLTHANRTASSSPAFRDSKIPLRSPLSAEAPSKDPPNSTLRGRTSTSRLGYRERVVSPGPYSQQVLSSPILRPRQLHSQASAPTLKSAQSPVASRRISLQPSDAISTGSPLAKSKAAPRPSSSLATNRRTSLLPHPRGRTDSSVTGRESPQAIAGAATAMRVASRAASRATSRAGMNGKGTDADKPQWR